MRFLPDICDMGVKKTIMIGIKSITLPVMFIQQAK